jgi:hypothetical protein
MAAAGLLVIGGFVVATPGGGIMPLSQCRSPRLALPILAPTVLISLVLIRRQAFGAETVARILIAMHKRRR